ncbi:hypothetical protein N7481_011900, partial [Penicillium waksmanii]|uniref:uncharacterized protein n=1 Tax=Penicillium waksmanii TaxID=69791 RepID=UPI002546DBB5
VPQTTAHDNIVQVSRPMNIAMSAIQPNINYRQSRRSACDRCRGFKLRCERYQVNGRSCERCLKAQVTCTTTVGQPVQQFHSPKKDIYSFSRSRVEISGDRGGPTASQVLHRSSGSRVRKATASSGVCRRIEQQKLNASIDPNIFPFLENDAASNFSDTKEPQMHSVSHQLLSFNQWSQDYLPWNDISPYPPSMYHDMHVTENNLNSENPGFGPDILDIPQHLPTDSGFDSTNPIKNDTFNSPIYIHPSISGSRWGSEPSSAQYEYPFPTTNHYAQYSYDQLRNIMQLNVELISDLELLDAASNNLSSSLVMSENSDQGASKIDLPIFRILNHSSKFLDIVQPGAMFPINDVWNLSPITPTEHDTSPREDSCSVPNEGVNGWLDFDDIPSFMTSHEPGYTEIRPALSNVFGDTSSPGYQLSESLTILSAYFQLIHIYHSLFTQIYQTLLMIPPDDAAKVLALPTLQFGGFEMEGHFKAKLQVLVELSFGILRKLDHSFGIPEYLPGEFIEEGSSAPYISYHSPLEPLRNHVVAREYMEAVLPLRKVMHCLQAFSNTIADVTV